MEDKITSEIEIDGTPLSTFSYLTIKQSFNTHHWFELHVNHDTFEVLGSGKADTSRNLVGKPIFINITETLSGRFTLFSGIICEIGLSQSDGLRGDLILRGYSPTILLDNGVNLNSFKAKTLNDIVTAVTSKVVANDLRMEVKAAYTKPIPYMSQYKESTFSFLNRLSSEYGEWFYYDGVHTKFGKPDSLPEIDLVYGREISSMNWSMKVSPVSFSQYSYNSSENQMNEGVAPDSVDGVDADTLFALNKSQDVFTDTVNMPLKPRTKNQAELDELMKRRKESAAASLVGLLAKSNAAAVNIGTIANIKISKKELIDFVVEDYGQYLITSVTHELDGNHRYRNTFEAIPATSNVIPVKNVRYPVAESQVATVMANNDPNGMGRVQVQFLWQQKKGDRTEWLRVLTPDAGSGNDSRKNRGFFIHPEVGDQVIVGFRYNDPNRPFVMGSIPHGKNIDSHHIQQNHVKAITTRSGSQVLFNDTKHHIKISTSAGNIIKIHEKTGAISITSASSISLNSEVINIHASQLVDIQAPKITVGNIAAPAPASGDENAKQPAATETIEMKAKVIDIKADQKLTGTAPNTTLEGKKKNLIKSDTLVDIAGGAGANVHATLVKIN